MLSRSLLQNVCSRSFFGLLSIALAVTAAQLSVPDRADAGTQQLSSSVFPDCSPNSDDVSPVAGVRCIDGVMMSTRRYLNINCIIDFRATVRDQREVYEPGECYGSGSKREWIEAIAASRGIAWVNRSSGAGIGGVDAGLQWEPNIGKPDFTKPDHSAYKGPIRPDVIRYDPEIDGSVELVEFKRSSEANDRKLDDQLRSYERQWPGKSRLARSSGFAADMAGDAFDVRMGTCPDGETDILDTYETSAGTETGTVLVQRTFTTDCDDEKRRKVDRWEKDAEIELEPFQEISLSENDDEGSDVWKSFDETDYFSTMCSSYWWLDCITSFGITLPTPSEALLVGISILWLVAQLLPQVRGPVLTAQILRVAIGRLQGLLISHVIGDPHLTTMDGLSYPLQGVGEFILLEDATTTSGFELQSRFSPMGTSTIASTASAYAMRLNGYEVQLSPGGNLKVDGQPRSLSSDAYFNLGNGAALIRSGDQWLAISAGDSDRPMVLYDASVNDIKLYLPEQMRTQGLLGNNDDVKSNDLRIRDGAQLASNVSPQTIHGDFADSWRVSAQESLFSYGAGESTTTFTDLTFPTDILTIDDFDELDRLAAAEACRDAGVLEGTPMRACVFDRLVSDSDDFINAAVAVTNPGVLAADRGPDPTGLLTEDFESDVAPNLNYGRLGTDSGYGGSFAGPLRERNSYGFSTHSELGRAGASANFDLIVAGDWSSSTSQSLEVMLDGEQEFQASIIGDPVSEAPTSSELGAPVRTGLLASGDPFWVFNVQAATDHTTTNDLTGEVRLNGPSLDRVFGVDNVEIEHDLVDHEMFEIELGAEVFRIEADEPDEGAGTLESAAAVDVYEFDVPSGGKTVALDGVDCDLGAVRWRIKSSSGSTAAAGTCNSPGRVPLGAGAYDLLVDSPNNDSGEYTIDAYFAPAPQHFELALSDTPTAVSDGAPQSGAGRLETVASRDIYEFTVDVGKTLVLDHLSCPAYGTGMRWTLKNNVGKTVESNFCHVNRTFANLGAGDYSLEFQSAGGHRGEYSFDLFYLPDPDRESVELSMTPLAIPSASTSSGVGSIETSKSNDRIEFEVPAGGRSVAADFVSCPWYLWTKWTLVDADSQALISSGSCEGVRTALLPQGDYELILESMHGTTGDYALNLYFKPDPDVFDVNVTTTPAVMNPVAQGPGAGDIETPASVDVYRFSVPAGGRKVRVEPASCTVATAAFAWDLVKRSDGSVVSSGNCLAKEGLDLAAGDYEIRMRTVNTSVGPYSLTLYFVRDDDTVGLTVTTSPTEVQPSTSDGVGNIETMVSRDLYRFELAEGESSVYLDSLSCASIFNTQWVLARDGQSGEVATGLCGGDQRIDGLEPGDYTLTWSAYGPNTGSYGFSLRVIPQPDTFDLSLGSAATAISNGVPSNGAGNLEHQFVADHYRFSSNANGDALLVRNLGYPGAATHWLIRDRTTGHEVFRGFIMGDQAVPLEPSHDYQLEYVSTGSSGTYSLELSFVPAPDVFDLELSTSPLVVSDGDPDDGAGNIESLASVDMYRFTVPAGGKSVYLDNQGCPFNNAGLSWRLINRATGAEVHAADPCSNDKRFELAAGEYQLEYARNLWNATGAYQFALFFAPDPQDFALTINRAPNLTTVSDGVPQAGAGKLENAGSIDRYTLTVPSGGKTLTVDNVGCASNGGIKWRVVDIGSNTTVADEPCVLDRSLPLSAGTYRLEVYSNGDAGTYAFNLSWQPGLDYFEVTLSTTPLVVSQGVPGEGAGWIETLQSVDAYRFSVPAGGKTVVLEGGSCPWYGYAFEWRMVRVQSPTTLATDYCSGDRSFELAEGEYQVEYWPNGLGQTGTYDFTLKFAS